MKKIGFVSVLVIALWGCSEITQPTSSSNEQPTGATAVQLGEKLENPYSVENMKQAQINLRSRGVEVPGEIVPNFYYVRFLPQDSTDMDELYFGTDLTLFDYPLDYEVLTENGDYYRDPDLAEGQPNSQYTAVPIGYQFPAVPYEILEELYIPEDETDASLSRSSSNFNLLNMLENEALEITGHISSTPSGERKTRGKWNPSGHIKVYDENLGMNVGVPGVEVRGRNWFRWRTTHTDENGYYRLDYFRGKDLGFSIKWEQKNERFDVRSGKIGQAFTDGPNNATSWNPVFQSHRSRFWAHIFRAGYYYINNDYGFGDRPFDYISIQAMYDENHPSDKSAYYRAWNDNIRIWEKNHNGTRIDPLNLISVVAHELGHAHHDERYPRGAVSFSKIDSNVKESWAVAMGYYIPRLIYTHTQFQNGTWWGTQYRSWKNTVPDDGTHYNYTPLVRDLIDTINQSEINDFVSGYTLKQIMDVLNDDDCTTFDDFKKKLKDNYDNPTEEYLDLLFSEMYPRTSMSRTLAFLDASAWNMNTSQSKTFFAEEDGYISANLGTNSNFTFTTDNPLSDLWGTSWERTYIDVKLAYSADASWAPAKYLGNLQVQFSASENSSYTWAGQFEINQINSTPVDGYIQLQYRFILPSHITSALQANPNYLKLMFSANPGAEFKVYDISFGDAGSEENRVLNLTSNQKSSAVSYSSFITNTGNFVDLSTLIVYKDENGKRKYYSIRQESSYPMYLVEQWARLSAYEPGVETYYGIWRQCWSYLGKGTL